MHFFFSFVVWHVGHFGHLSEAKATIYEEKGLTAPDIEKGSKGHSES
jgi:hypothetical protein